MVTVGDGATTTFAAVQEAVVPPFDPIHDHVQGPEPATVDEVPVAQRFVAGTEESVWLCEVPQTPLTGEGVAGVGTTTGAATITVTLPLTLPPAPVQLTV